ncbi:MAG: VOC family protein [bacterium]
MKTSLINAVILAENYDKLVDWYIQTFTLDVEHKVEKDYHYTELAQNGHSVVGIAKTEEMGVTPTKPRNNSVIVQIMVSNIYELCDRIKAHGKVLFGPTRDKDEGFTYGGIADPEGNQIWLVERKSKDK